jgi:hypothetical protein
MKILVTGAAGTVAAASLVPSPALATRPSLLFAIRRSMTRRKAWK